MIPCIFGLIIIRNLIRFQEYTIHIFGVFHFLEYVNIEQIAIDLYDVSLPMRVA